MPAIDYVKVKIVVEVTRISVADDRFGDAVTEALSMVQVNPAFGRVVSATVER